MTKTSGPYRPAGTRGPSLLCVSVCAWFCVCKCQQLLSPHRSALSHRHTYRKMNSRLELASGTLILFSVFALVSMPQQAEKHLSSKSLQTTTLVNLIKDIADNKRTIKQKSFQHPRRAYIAVAHRVIALSFTSQRFFKVISLLRLLPPPSLPVNLVMLVVWNNSFNSGMSSTIDFSVKLK